MPGMRQIRLGTSGFSYKEWKGIFYPPDLPPREMLRYYASRFNSVEVDGTFYRVPSAATIEGWLAATPVDFSFAIKAHQRLTHRERLKTPSETLRHWNAAVSLLGGRLGCVLYQLPPFFRADLGRLDAFLAHLPESVKSVFEFRHESWFSSETYALLRTRHAALCIHDADERTTPLELTAPYTYVRLRRSSYSAEERLHWQERLRQWANDGIEVFAYVKHEDNPNAPVVALEFAAGL